MTNDAANDVVHLKAGAQLPAVPVTSPTTEILKQLLEQMLANERRRLRNEYIRLALFVIVILAAAVGGSLWFTHSLLEQLRSERQTADRSMQALLQRAEPMTPSLESSVRVPARDRPAALADTNAIQTQADIKRLFSDLEAKKQALADMLKTQDAQTKSLLQSRDNELQVLHERMQEVQRKIMNAAPPEAQPAKEAQTPPAIEKAASDSLIVTTTNAVILRLPIPKP